MSEQTHTTDTLLHMEHMAQLLNAWPHLRCHVNADTMLTQAHMRDIRHTLEHARRLFRMLHTGKATIIIHES